MKQENSTTKKYLLTVTVDEEQLIKSYTGDDETIQRYDLPPIYELILFECGLLSSSGLLVYKVEEVKE